LGLEGSGSRYAKGEGCEENFQVLHIYP
jgi:hypothetical protein